jgi:hypothetical protein
VADAPRGAPEPPEPPDGLTDTQAAEWVELWQQPVAKFWLPADGVFVLRLLRLREQLEELGGKAPLGMYSAILNLERTLFLTPGARRERLKLAVADPPPSDVPTRPSPRSSSTQTTARERERLLRG